jgi:hypothetical protein
MAESRRTRKAPFAPCCITPQLGQHLGAKHLKPALHARAVAAIDVTELALEIGFLAGDYAVADDEGEGHQR